MLCLKEMWSKSINSLSVEYCGNQMYGNVISVRTRFGCSADNHTSAARVSVATTSWRSTSHLRSLFLNAQNAAQPRLQGKVR